MGMLLFAVHFLGQASASGGRNVCIDEGDGAF